MSITRQFALAALLIGAVSVGGCGDEETTTPVQKNAQVNVVHASPNAPGVDLYVDNAKAGTNLMFPDATGYLPVPSGTRNVKVKVTGTATTVIEANLPLQADAYYSVFAVDSVSKISAVVLADTLTTPAAGKAHVRFVHLSPNAPAVDVAVTGGPVIWSNKSFRGATSFLPLDAGTYNLEVRLAGTATVALPLPGVTLQAGKIYTVFARGFAGGTGAQALNARILVNR
jgi:hypothetical protein